MSAQSWHERVAADLALSVPGDDPRRESARRLMALRPPGMPPPGPSGIDWANDPGALGAELRRLREASAPLVLALPPEPPQAVPEPQTQPEPEPLGYVTVVRHDGGVLTPVGPVEALPGITWQEVKYWRADGADAFLAVLYAVPADDTAGWS